MEKNSSNDPNQTNTGAKVEGYFQPSGQAGGNYGKDYHPLEGGDLMRTPVLPDGTPEGETIGNVKVSAKLAQRLRQKMAAPQPVVPEPSPPGELGRVQPMGTPKAPPESSHGGLTSRLESLLGAESSIDSSGIEEEELQALLQNMKDQNPAFYARRSQQTLPEG
jgi:hypothetical protein